MKAKLLKAGIVGAVLASTAAWAGYTSTHYVNIDTTTRTVSGSLANARSSSDTNQLLSCAVRGWSDGRSSVICEAQDANGVNVYCMSNVPSIVSAATGISGDSYLLFKYDTNGACTYLYVSNASSHAPRQP